MRTIKLTVCGLLLSVILLAVPLVFSQPVSAQSPWQVSYWNNDSLTGDPVVTRQELAINTIGAQVHPTHALKATPFLHVGPRQKMQPLTPQSQRLHFLVLMRQTNCDKLWSSWV